MLWDAKVGHQQFTGAWRGPALLFILFLQIGVVLQSLLVLLKCHSASNAVTLRFLGFVVVVF